MVRPSRRRLVKAGISSRLYGIIQKAQKAGFHQPSAKNSYIFSYINLFDSLYITDYQSINQCYQYPEPESNRHELAFIGF